MGSTWDIGKQPTHHELPTHPSNHWPHGCLLPSWTSTHKLQDLGQVHEWRGELSWSNLSRRRVLSSGRMVLLSWGRILCRHSIKLPRHQAQLCQYSECGREHPSKGRSSSS